MKRGMEKHTKSGALLTRMAESIGSNLGTLVAKAGAAQKVLTRSSVAHTVERQGKQLMRKSEVVANKTKKFAVRNLKRSKLARVTARRRPPTISTSEQRLRRGTAKVRAARRLRGKR